MTPADPRPSIYEFAGGDDAFLKLAAAHHERCLNDPLLSHAFSHGVHPNHVEHLAEYWAEVFGGPPRFSERHGGQGAMLALHAHTGAPPEMSRRFAEIFLQAVDDAGLPSDTDFRRALAGYIGWATAEIDEVSPHDAEIDPSRTLPRWSWEGRLS